MARKLIAQEVQDSILLKSRRRCCICYGLRRDISIREGQIAHLDQNPSNNASDNLAFLCLEHHNWYDSRTSQSKGPTIGEVKTYRNELYEDIYTAWKQPIEAGQIILRPQDPVEGRYYWESPNASAELQIQRVATTRVKVIGNAYWGTKRAGGPNIGLLDFEAQIESNRIFYSTEVAHGHGETLVHTIEIIYRDGHLFVNEEPFGRVHGMNVTFSGEYQRGQEKATTRNCQV